MMEPLILTPPGFTELEIGPNGPESSYKGFVLHGPEYPNSPIVVWKTSDDFDAHPHHEEGLEAMGLVKKVNERYNAFWSEQGSEPTFVYPGSDVDLVRDALNLTNSDWSDGDWSFDSDLDVTAAFQTITTPLNEMINEINGRGWEVGKIEWGDGGYVARATNPHSEELEATGPTEQTAIGNLLSKVMRRETARQGSVRAAGWDSSFSNSMEEIAKAYVAAPTYDPNAAAAWKELADDSMRRIEVLADQIQIEYTPEPEPYETPQEMCEDVHKNQHIFVSTANSIHPVWTAEQNAAFRAVHDVLGHCVSGGDFGWEGENKACAAHFPLLSSLAQKALFTECIGQAAAAAYYRSFMPQKVCFLDDFLGEVQDEENSIGQGVHPSQSLAPVEMPSIEPSQMEGLSWATQVPSTDFTGALPVFGANLNRDPNYEWQSGVDPMPNNPYIWSEGDTDPIDIYQTQELANKLQTDWADAIHPDGTPDYDRMKQAIVGAFRAVLLSPRKDLKWNAVHYQDLMNVPASVTDPKVYWDTLDERRESWNQARGFASGSHKAYWKAEQTLKAIIRSMNDDLSIQEADQIAEREILNMRAEEEARLLSDPKSEKWDAQELENQVSKALDKRLNAIIKPKQEKFDVEQLSFEGAVEPVQVDFEGKEAGKYGAFMYSHLKAIAQISYHADELLDAAVDDVQEYGGAGHHFRNTVLQLQIPGVGPKVASLAWLLLQPVTSELATIDSHMMEALGHDYSEMNDRDYYKYERELRTGRDAAGYGHVPLGQFQWGMWDYKRSGPGSHQDHSPLRPLNPTPHDQVQWEQKLPVQEQWMPPEWWEATGDARAEAARRWDGEVSPQFARDVIPRLSKLSYRGWGPLKSFNHWWERRRETKHRKFTISGDSRILAEYALGEKLARGKLSKYVSEHRDDIRGDWKKFKKAILKEYDHLKELRKYYSSVENAKIPWVVFNNEVFVGQQGGTFMGLARDNLGLSTMDVWQKLPEASFSVGTFDPTTRAITSPEALDPNQEASILQALVNR
jgi:hypothetical protein